MNSDQIRYFLTLAGELHFWNAAEKLFMTQSALSRQIKSLEQELGVQLFERSKRSVRLTEAGSFLREQWLRISEEMEKVHRQAKSIHDGSYGTVSLAYPGSIAYAFLPALIAAVAKDLPAVKIELVEPTDVSVEQLLLSHQLDLALRRDPARNPALQSAVLYSEHFSLVVPAGHALDQQNFKSLQQVSEEKFILSGLQHNTYYVSLLRDLFRSYGFTPNVHIESDFGSMILSLVARGLGVSILPGSYDSSAPASVRFITLPQTTNLYAAWRKDDNSPVLKNVLSLVKATSRNFGKH